MVHYRRISIGGRKRPPFLTVPFCLSGSQLFDPVQACIKKHPIAFAEIVFVFIQFRNEITVALASAFAHPVVFAVFTVQRQLSGTFDKCNFFSLFVRLGEVVFVKIPEKIFVKHIEITRVDVVVCLYDILDAAYAALIAGSWKVSGSHADVVLELTDIWRVASQTVLIAEVKKINKKLTVEFWRQCVWRFSMSFFQRIKSGNVLLVQPVSFLIITIYGPGFFCDGGCDNRQNVVIHLETVHQICCVQDSGKSLASAFVMAQRIVDFFCSVYRKSD